MAHSHSHADSHLPKDNNARRLLFAFIVTAGFMLLEVVGGYSPALWRCWRMRDICSPTRRPFSLRCWRFNFPVVPDCSPHFWLAKTHHTGGFCECHCVGGHYPSHCLGSDRALYTPRPVAGNLMMVIAVAGLLANLFAFWILHREAMKKPERARCRATCDGRFAGFRRRNNRRADHYLDGLDASGPDSLYSGFGTGATQRLAFVKR